MIIERSFDYDLINSILTDPVIFSTISEDCDVDRETYRTREHDSIWYLVAYVDDAPIGVFIVHPDSGCSYQLHANMLKQYRKEYSRQAVSMAIGFAFQNIGTRKINANIPAIYPNVIKCAEDCGFVHEGVRSRFYMKNGKAVDVVLMGVTR